MAGRRRNALWDHFQKQEDGSLLCMGCRTLSLPAASRITYLQTHFSQCTALQKRVHTSKIISETCSSTSSRKTKDGSVLKWIQDSTDKSAARRFEEACVRFALSTNMSILALSSPEFCFAAQHTHEVGGAHSIGYGAARKAISRLKGFVRCEKKEMMKGQCVCLVLDGWKVRYRREHAHAFLFADWK